MTIKRISLGSVGIQGPEAVVGVELATPASVVPDIVIYFAHNGFALHSFKNGKPYVVIATDRSELLNEIKSLLKRGDD